MLRFKMVGCAINTPRHTLFMGEIMVGKKFGRLLVVSQAPSRHARSQWNCLCDCGNTCIAPGKSMRQGKKQSCGCLRREINKERIKTLIQSNILPPGEAACNLLYATYRSSADKRHLDFSLTKDDFKSLTKADCFYCGKSPFAVCKPDIGGGYQYNGIDRRNNDLGYVISNVVSCCKFCNWMKNAFTEADFIQHCFDVVMHQNNLRTRHGTIKAETSELGESLGRTPRFENYYGDNTKTS